MHEQDLVVLLDDLLQSEEGQCVEFKTNNSNPTSIGEYISALANSAVIQKKSEAYLVWGIEDETKTPIGTSFKPLSKKVGNQALEMWLSQKLKPKPFFEFKSFQYKSKRVVLLSIKPVKERPVKFEGTAFIRVGSHKTRLDDQPGLQTEFWRYNRCNISRIFSSK